MTAADVSEWTPIETAPSLSALVGARLREVRKRLGLSLQDVERAGGPKQAVNGAYERGERNIALNQVDRLARLYGVPVWELLDERPVAVSARLHAELGLLALDIHRVLVQLETDAQTDTPIPFEVAS